MRFGCWIGQVQGEDVGVDADCRLFVEILGEGQLLRVGRKCASASATIQRERGYVARIVGREIPHRAVLHRNQKQMAAFFAGVVVPMAVEQASEDLRLHRARRQRRIPIRITLVAGGRVRRGDCLAVWKHRGSNDHRLAVGGPDGVVGFGRDCGQFLRVGCFAVETVELGDPDLLRSASAAEEEDMFAVGRKLRTTVAGLRRGKFLGLSARDEPDKQLRRLCILLQVDRG